VSGSYKNPTTNPTYCPPKPDKSQFSHRALTTLTILIIDNEISNNGSGDRQAIWGVYVSLECWKMLHDRSASLCKTIVMSEFVKHKGWLIQSAPTPRGERGWGVMVNLIDAVSSPVAHTGPHIGPAGFATREEAYQAGVAWAIQAINKGED
jgi:hypothetical protein